MAAAASTPARRLSGSSLLIAGSLGAAACLTVIALAQALTDNRSVSTAAQPTQTLIVSDTSSASTITPLISSTTVPASSDDGSAESQIVSVSIDRATNSAEHHLVSILTDGAPAGAAVLIGDHLITSTDVAGERLSIEYRRFGTDVAATAYLVGVDPFSDLAFYRPSARTMASQTLDAIAAGATPVSLPDPTIDRTGGVVILATVDPGHLDSVHTSVGLVMATGTEHIGSDGQPLVGLIDTSLRQPEHAGGLLLDTEGDLVGIVVGTSSSLASAVPIDDALVIADHLVQQGWASEAWIGFEGMDNGGGVEVIEVDPAGPAAAAGLAPGDIITFFGSTRVDHMADITAQLRSATPGDTLVCLVERAGAPVALRIDAAAYGADRGEVSEPAGG